MASAAESHITDVKEKLHQFVNDLPPGISMEEALERIALLFEIERRLADFDESKCLTHEEVVQRMAQWLE